MQVSRALPVSVSQVHTSQRRAQRAGQSANTANANVPSPSKQGFIPTPASAGPPSDAHSAATPAHVSNVDLKSPDKQGFIPTPASDSAPGGTADPAGRSVSVPTFGSAGFTFPYEESLPIRGAAGSGSKPGSSSGTNPESTPAHVSNVDLKSPDKQGFIPTPASQPAPDQPEKGDGAGNGPNPTPAPVFPDPDYTPRDEAAVLSDDSAPRPNPEPAPFARAAHSRVGRLLDLRG